MTAPMQVAVVRPKKSGAEAVGYFLGGLLGTAAVAWTLMLIAGAITAWHPSYAHSLLALIGIRLLQNGSGWRAWTHRVNGSWL